MKKIVFVCLLGLGSLAAQAQHLNLGVRAGVNYATASGDHAQNTSRRVGFIAGGIFNIGFTDAISLQPELNYSSKGYKYEETKNAETTIEQTKLDYLDIPVLLNVSAGNLFFELGPQASFILSGKQENEIIVVNNNNEESKKHTTDISDNPYTIDFGYVAGIGYRLPSGLGLGLRYSGSIKDIYDEGPRADKNMRHSLFQLSASYVTGW